MEDKKHSKNAKLFVRIFPSMDISHEDVKISADLKTLQIRSLQDFLPGRKRVVSNESRFLSFETDGVFYNVSQDEIYDKVMGAEIVEKVFTGMNAVVLGYGQTGTGKSFTINGMRNVYECRGLAPRLISELFNVRNNKKREIHVNFEISFIEIIGKQINDLLRTKPKTHTFGSDLKNVTIYPLNSEKHGLEMLFNGEGRRICENAPYFGANRAHSVMTIYITSQNMLYSMSPVHYGKIHLVDLAGIDTVGKETSEWKRGRDIGQANLTKSFLEQYLTKTNTKKQVVMNDLLIQYLGSVENCAMRYVAHISGALPDLELTISSLKFGANVSGSKYSKQVVSNKEKTVEKVDTGLDRIRYISEQLELNAMLFDQPDYAVAETKLCPARLGHLRRLAESYIKGETTELQLMSVVQSTVSMKVFKEIYDKLIEERQPVVKELEQLETVLDERKLEKVSSQGSMRLADKKKHSNSSSNMKKKRDSSNSKQKKDSLVDSTISLSVRAKKYSKKSSKKSSKTTADSKPTSAVVPSKPIEPVREIDRFGITIGPGNVTRYEGAYTQAEKKLRAQQAKELHNKDEVNVDDRTVVNDDDICNTYRFINHVEDPVKTEEQPEQVIKVEKKESLLSGQVKDASSKRTSDTPARKTTATDKKGGKKTVDKKGKRSPGSVSPRTRKESIPSLAGDRIVSKLQNIQDNNPFLPPTPTPSLEPTWELYLQSGIKEKLQDELNQAEANGRESYQVYLKLMEDLQQCRRLLTETRHQLEETQHKRHLSGEERYDAEGRVVTSDEEVNLMKSVREKEMEMGVIKTSLVRQRIALNESLANVEKAKRTSDEGYGNFRANLDDGQQSTERGNDAERANDAEQAVRQSFVCEVDPRMGHYNYLRDTRLGFAREGTKLYGK